MDVICLGELLIDLIGEEASNLAGIKTFKKFPGGAAGNIAAGVSQLGLKSGFIGKVGQDPFGDFLLKTMSSYNVDITQIYRDKDRKTGLAFVSLNENGVPDYLFYRDPSASMFLKPEEVEENYLKQGRALYFSSISLANQPCRSANYEAIKYACNYGLKVVFDPNIRISLWESQKKARAEIKKVIGYTDVLKINTVELEFLMGKGNKKEQCRQLFRKYPKLELLALTLGEKGALLLNRKEEFVEVETIDVSVKDTTGAGDAFVSALIKCILKIDKIIGKKDLYKIGKYANTAASLIIQKQGVIPAMPTLKEIEAYINRW